MKIKKKMIPLLIDFGRALGPKLAPYWDHVGYKTPSKATSYTKLKKAFKKELRRKAKDGEGTASLGPRMRNIQPKLVDQRLEREKNTPYS